MTWSSRVSRTVRVQVMFGLLAVMGDPTLAHGQAANQAAFQTRFDQALAVFNSARQPEAIPQFSLLIDDLRALPTRSSALTTLLARALQYRAQARENVGQTADADADLRLIRDVAPTYRLTDPGLSASLVSRFNALVPTGQPPSTPAPAPAPPQNQPPGPAGPKPITVSAGYQFVKYNDCNDCTFPGGFYADVAGGILPFLSWVGELSGASGSCCGNDTSLTTLFFGGGARVHPRLVTRLSPFAQVLVGGGRQSFDGAAEAKGAVNLSGGADYRVTPRLGARFGIGYVKMFSEFGSQSWIRVAAGIAVRTP